jgi:AcrR family transcriptional regulator
MPESLRLSSSGKATEEKILQSAVKLFSSNWYGSVSVAEICRAAGLSNGVFYRYFGGKAELCRTILGIIQKKIAEALEGVEGPTTGERLARFVDILMDFSLYHPDLIAVFREGQYRFIEYETSLEGLYRDSLSALLGSEASLEEATFVLGGIRYCAIRRGLGGIALEPSSVLAIIERGLFPGQKAREEKVFAGPVQPLPEDKGEGAREALLRAGKRLFGEKDFVEANIYEITDAAGLAVGTFYTYFPSKDEFFAELIRRVGHDARRFISSNIPGGLNRLEREMRGLWLFITYLKTDRDCYNIVRQAEFILPAEAKAYYAAFTSGYAKRPLGPDGLAPGLDEATAIEFIQGVGHYLGISSVLAGGPGSLEETIKAIGELFADGLSGRLGGGPGPIS